MLVELEIIKRKKKNGFEEIDLRHTQKKTPANRFFQLMSLLVS